MAFDAYFKHVVPIKMTFTEQLDSGICYTDQEGYVRKNCYRLQVALDEIDEMANAIDIYRYHHFTACICKISGKLSLYVFPTSANKRSVEKILKTFPEEAARKIIKEGDFLDWNFSFINRAFKRTDSKRLVLSIT